MTWVAGVGRNVFQGFLGLVMIVAVTMVGVGLLALAKIGPFLASGREEER